MMDLGTRKIVKQEVQRDLVDEVLFHPGGRLLVTRSKGPDTVIRNAADLSPYKFAVDVPYSILWDALLAPRGSCPAAFDADGRRVALVNGSRGFKAWSLDHFEEKRRYVLELSFDALPLDAATNAEWRRGRGAPLLLLNHATALRFEGERLWLGLEDGFLVAVHPNLLQPLTDPIDDEKWGSGNGVKKPDTVNAARPHAVQSLEKARTFRPHDGDITSILVVAGDRGLVTAGLDGKVLIWKIQDILDRRLPKNDLEKLKEPLPLETLEGHFAAVSKDGRTLAVAEPKGVRCYDLASLKPISWTPTDPKLGMPARVKFSPDGSLLAVTLCPCSVCSKADVIYTMGKPKMKSHHHGGSLVTYKTASAPGGTGR